MFAPKERAREIMAYAYVLQHHDGDRIEAAEALASEAYRAGLERAANIVGSCNATWKPGAAAELIRAELEKVKG